MYKQPPDSTRLLFSVPNGPTSQPTNRLKKKAHNQPQIRLTKEMLRRDKKKMTEMSCLSSGIGDGCGCHVHVCVCVCVRVYVMCIHVPPFLYIYVYICVYI